MTVRNSLLGIAGLVLSGLGIVLCIVALIAVWFVSARLGRLTTSVFSRMDTSLSVVRERAVKTQQRLGVAKSTTEDLENNIREWAKQQASQRIEMQFDAAGKAERLNSALQQADEWLEMAQTSVENIQEMLAIYRPTSTGDDTTLVDQLAMEIAAVRSRLAEPIQLATSIHDRLSDVREDKLPGEKIDEVVSFAVRVVATLSSLDSRFENLVDRLSAVQSQLQQLEARAQRWLLVIPIGLSLIILLMAAGQAALFRLAKQRSAN